VTPDENNRLAMFSIMAVVVIVVLVAIIFA
jgi:hypothetical protein